jgi:20S proteasome alpha/beta subunit
MVADKQMDYHSVEVVKLFELSDGWIGGAGNYAQIRIAIDYLNNADKYNGPPSVQDFTLLRAYSETGKLSLYINSFVETPLKEEYFSIGSGSDYAMGAMDAGAQAKEALQIASKRDAATGPKLTVVAVR